MKKFTRKRRFRQRRAFKKRGFKKKFKKSNYDGVYGAKCSIQAPIVVSSAGFGDMVVDWGCITVSNSSTQVISVSQSPEFTTLSANWREWKLVGIKTKVKIPQQTALAIFPIGISSVTVASQGNNLIQYQEYQSASFTSVSAAALPTAAQMIAQWDYKTKPCLPQIKNYKAIGKYWKKLNGQAWNATDGGGLNCAPYYIPSNGTASSTDLVSNQVHRVVTQGFAVGATVANIDVDYYVKFRGLHV